VRRIHLSAGLCVAALCLAAAAAGPARAATACSDPGLSLDPAIYTPVPGGLAPTGSVGCEIADTISNDSETGVNATEAFFARLDATDWALQERVTFVEGDGTVGYEGSGDVGFMELATDLPGDGEQNPDQVGSGIRTNADGPALETWSVDPGKLLPGTQLMLLFKGSPNADPAAVVSYLIGPGVFSGQYLSPLSGGGGQAQAISHASLYTRTLLKPPPEITTTPVPGGLPLLMAGLCAIWAVRRGRGS